MKLSLRTVASAVVLSTCLLATARTAHAEEPAAPARAQAKSPPAEKTAVDSSLKRSESGGPAVTHSAAREAGAPVSSTHGQPVAAGQGRLEQIADRKGTSSSAAGKQAEVALDERGGAGARAAAMPAGVTRALPELRGKVRACFAKPQGSVDVTMAFGPGGEASQVTAARADITPDESACVTRVVRATRFRGVRATTVTVALPL